VRLASSVGRNVQNVERNSLSHTLTLNKNVFVVYAY